MVQDTELFDPAYPMVLVVPMTGDPALAIPDLICVAKTRITAAAKSQITPTELQQVRQLVVLTIGGLSWRERQAGGCPARGHHPSGAPRKPSAILKHLYAGASR